MNTKEVLTNEFSARYMEEDRTLVIYRSLKPSTDIAPIRLRLDTLLGMGRVDASKWVGETILLLIPEVRRQLFGIND